MNEYLKETKFDEKIIKDCYEKVNKNLKKYVSENILEKYNLNDKGHDKHHIKFVLQRAFEISKEYSINYDILYTCVCYHDIACHINRKEHEILSAEIAYKDKFLNDYFEKDELLLIKEAIEDHRASSNKIPRNIYGKILSSADRKIDIKAHLIASLVYEVDDINLIDVNIVIENSYQHAVKKYGKDGYAINKFYVEDVKYNEFIYNIQKLIDNKEEYFKVAKIVLDEIKKN